MNADMQGWGVWLALSAATVGTYICRAAGVKLSGHIHQDSEVFRWLSAVTYAMVAALTVRMILMPLGLLAKNSFHRSLCSARLAGDVTISKP